MGQLYISMLPLLGYVMMGRIAGRWLKIDIKQISTFVIYLLAPVLIFHSLATRQITASVIILPIVFFLCMLCVAGVVFVLSQKTTDDRQSRMLTFALPSVNQGYFGIPIALALFGNEMVAWLLISIAGILLYENTVGLYILFKGNYTTKEAIKKLLSIPHLYALGIGLMVSILHLHFGDLYMSMIDTVRSAYVLFGMAIVGLGLANLSFSRKYLGSSLLLSVARFIMMIIIYSLVGLALHTYTGLDSMMIKTIIILGFFPVAANSMAFSSLLDNNTDRVAMILLISTLLSALIVPFAPRFIDLLLAL